ncbi:MAG: amino acid-binding protein [Anaerolineaceae bacterium]|nr:amino acid-binding protein [Anaerolineaceae bacterium]
MILKRLSPGFAICKLPADAKLPDWSTQASLFFIARTDDELSIICPQSEVPAEIEASRDWICFRVDGDLDFEEIGVVARVSAPIADAGISLFLVSTHDRDYVLVHADNVTQAIDIYRDNGFTILNEDA